MLGSTGEGYWVYIFNPHTHVGRCGAPSSHWPTSAVDECLGGRVRDTGPLYLTHTAHRQAWCAPKSHQGTLQSAPHAPGGVAAFMSAHSKTPYITPSMDFSYGKGVVRGRRGQQLEFALRMGQPLYREVLYGILWRNTPGCWTYFIKQNMWVTIAHYDVPGTCSTRHCRELARARST